MAGEHEAVVVDPEPHSLQAGGVIDARVLPRLPDHRLRPARVRGVGEGIDHVVKLVEHPPIGQRVCLQPLVIGVLPLARCRVDPVIVDAVDDLLAVDLQVVDAAWQRAVDARLGERVANSQRQRHVAAGRIALPVILRRNAHSLLPAGQHSALPALSEVLCMHTYEWKVETSGHGDLTCELMR